MSQSKRPRQVNCESCGHQYAYIRRFGGRGGTRGLFVSPLHKIPEPDQGAKEQPLEPVPCPKCDKFTEEMKAKIQRDAKNHVPFAIKSASISGLICLGIYLLGVYTENRLYILGTLAAIAFLYSSLTLLARPKTEEEYLKDAEQAYLDESYTQKG